MPQANQAVDRNAKGRVELEARAGDRPRIYSFLLGGKRLGSQLVHVYP